MFKFHHTNRSIFLIAITEVGGYNELVTRYMQAAPSVAYYGINNETCPGFYPPPYAMNLLRPIDGADLPWTGVVFGLSMSSVWYWCTDQVFSLTRGRHAPACLD